VDKYVIVTNNPMRKARIEETQLEAVRLKFVNTLDDVIQTTRDMIHSGHRLISHPLAGSVKPVENPYRSIILSEETGPLDYESLRIFEHAVSQVNVFKQSYESDLTRYSQTLLTDYQLIDVSLIDSALSRLKLKR